MNGDRDGIDKTFYYLSNSIGGKFGNSAIIATRENVKMYVSQLEEEAVEGTGNEIVVCSNKTDMIEKISKELQGESEVGLNYDAIPLSTFQLIKETNKGIIFTNVAGNIKKARAIKSQEELDKIRRAARISIDIYDDFISSLYEGMTEIQAAGKLISMMLLKGASDSAFSPIVCFGSNSSMPHHSPSEKKLKIGDFVLTDYGAQFRRYCSDVTRTAVFGRAVRKQREMYDLVYRAQQESLTLIKDGANGKYVNQRAHEIIDSTEYIGKLIHGIGHGIGLYVHDHEALGNESVELKENMVITNEPGIYIPKYGGVRIEDDLIVKKDGFELITDKTPNELIEIS